MNTGLLGFFQQDPDKQEALRQGLLNAGIAMMAGGRQDLGTAVGQGMGAGVGIYRQQIEDLKRKQAQQALYQSAFTPGKPATPAAFRVGGKTYPTQAEAQAAARVPGGMAMGNQPLNLDYANYQPQGAELPVEQVPEQPAQPAQFDRSAFLQGAFANPEAGYADIAAKALLEPQQATKPQLVQRWNPQSQQVEQGWMTPGGTDFTPVGLAKPDAADDGFSQDMMDYLKSKGIDPRTADTSQLSAAYDAVQDIKTQRARMSGQTITLQSPQMFTAQDGTPVMVQPANRPGAAPQITPLPNLKPSTADKPPTEAENTAAGYLGRMRAASQQLPAFEKKGISTEQTAIAGAVPIVGDYLQRNVMTPEQQQYKQLADDWIRAKLRKESGAVIGADEMAAEYRTYFPQPGDGPEVIKQKTQARAQAERQMEISAGRSAEQAKPVSPVRPAPKPAQAQKAQGVGTFKSPYTVTNDDDFNSVPKGKYFKAPDGSIRVKP